MKVTMRSDDSPDVVVEAISESCNIAKLKQHIRTLQTSLRWLERERKILREASRAKVEQQRKVEAASKRQVQHA